MWYTVTCACGFPLASGVGLSAHWEQPHHSCRATHVTVTWTYTDAILKVLSSSVQRPSPAPPAAPPTAQP